MRIGLLARCDERGIAHQTREFFLAMKPHRTLVFCLNDPLWPEDTGKFYGTNVDFVNMKPDRVCDERKARKLLQDIDVLFAVETLMDWRIADWARDLGVRTVVQGNPEFYVHERFGWPHPDQWVWPTTWMQDQLPVGRLLPVPAPDEIAITAAHFTESPLRVLHVAGHAAAGDRNGTVDFMESLHHITREVVVTVIGQDGWLPETKAIPPNVSLQMQPSGVADRWSMYVGQHLVVLPRKYGGLCLPAIEAMASGCAVVMPDCPPNSMWPGPRINARKGRLHPAPYGPVQTYNLDPRHIAHVIDLYARHPADLAHEQETARAWYWGNRWSNWREEYLEVLS